MPFWGWSKTAASNATADPTVNWSEGQPPSSINDSARAMMARSAEWRDDISGAIVTGGSGAAYTLTANSAFAALADVNAQMIAFTPHATNTGAVTLSINGLTAKPIRPAPGVDLLEGSLILGTPYVVTYNNTDGVFYLQGGQGNPYSVPLGGLLDTTTVSVPNSAFAIPIGQTLSRTTYAKLWALAQVEIGLGNPLFTNGNGTTTFGIPDLRGRVAVAPDASAGRFAAVTIGAAGGVTGASQTLGPANLPNYTLSVSTSGTVTQTNQGAGGKYIPWAGSITTANMSVGGGSFYDMLGNGSTVGFGAINVVSSGSMAGSTSSINGGVAQTAFSVAMPWIGINKIMRVI